MEVGGTHSDHRLQLKRQRPAGDRPSTPSGETNTSEIRAKVVDIRRDSVTIKTSTGHEITGRLTADAGPINARIGETYTFTVGRGEGGETILSIHGKSHSAQHAGAIKDALTAMGINPNADNTRAAMALLENQVPITRENMQRMTQGVRHFGADALQKVMFFLENDMPLVPRLTSTLDALLEGQFKMAAQLGQIADGLRALPDTNLAGKIAEVLVRGEAALTQGELAAKLATAVAAKANNTQMGPGQQQALLAYAFANPHLSEAGVPRLAGALQTFMPAALDQILEMAQARLDFNRVVSENRGQMKEWLAQNIRGDGTDLQRFTQMLQDTMAKGEMRAPHAVAEIAATQAGARSALALIFEGDEAQLARALDSLGLARGLAGTAESAAAGVGKGGATAVPLPADMLDTLLQKLSFAPEAAPDRLGDFLERFLNDNRANFDLARQILAQSGDLASAAGAKVAAQLGAVCDNLEFVAHLRNNFYAQIPIMLGEHSTTAELYVFRDKNKRGGQGGGSASALVAIDTASLGRFEAYLVKQGNTLNCQFRLESEEVREHVAAHLPELRDALTAHGYNLEAVTYREADEPFAVTDKEAKLMREDDEAIADMPGEQRRTSFDVRV